LDGGHLVFFTVEAIRRKPLSMRTRELFQQVGLFLLISLMFFVFYNDLVHIFNGK
jgi:regulator of sigma E protease